MAENHPVGFQWPMEAKRRGAKLIHIDPRFSRTSALADLYVPIRAGSDVAFLGGIVNYILEGGHYFEEYVKAYTNAGTIMSARAPYGTRRLAEMAFHAGIAPEVERVPIVGLCRQRDVICRREVRKQRGDLERACQPERTAPPRRQAGDILSGKMNGAGIRQQLSGELADQRGLAGAVRSDDRVQFALRNIERKIVGRDDPAKPPAKIFDAKQGLSHGSASPAVP